MTQEIHESWKPIFRTLFHDPGFAAIKEMLSSGVEICPAKEHIFKPFRLPIGRIKVAIIGEDPYPTNKLAQGIAFSVPQHIPEFEWPGSLKVMIESLEETMYPTTPADLYGPTGNLSLWEDGGVLLINRFFTCLPGAPGSHQQLWSWFTEELVRLLDEEKAITYYLLGDKAQELKSVIKKGKVYVDEHPTSIVRKRKQGIEAKMQGHWAEINAETGVIFFLPF